VPHFSLPAIAGFFLWFLIMDKANRTPSRWTNVILIYRMMLRYWHLMLAGIVGMLFFAFFNGASVTLMIPLFDYVFNPNKNAIIFHNWQAFLQAMGSMLQSHVANFGGLVPALQNYAPLWENSKAIMLQTDSLSLLYVLCVLVFVIIFLINLFFFVHRVLFNGLRGQTIRDIRSYMFGRYLGQSLDFFSSNRTGDAIVRMVNDVEIVSEQLINSVISALREIITVLVFARIAYLLNAKLFVYSIVVLPLFTLMVSMLGKKIKKYSKRIQEQLSFLFSNVEEVLNSMKIVQAFRHEKMEYMHFQAINNRHYKLWYRSQNYSSLNMPISEINSAITGIVVIIIGGNMILTPGSGFSLGDFTAFLFALFSMLHPLKVITQVYTDIRRALVSLDRIAPVMNQISEIVDKPDAIDKQEFSSEIRFEKVGFYYKPGKPVLHDINISIPKGCKIAFVGSSGGGKTTIANLINRLYDVKEGSIKLDGTDVRDIKLDSLRRLFGIVTQDSILFTKSIRENIAYGSQNPVSNEEIIAAAKIANADEFICEFPDTYDHILGSKGSDLSGGQKQRICIARAIVADPPVLIFDEATSALDTDSEKKVQDAIDEATRNRTVIMIAHRLSTVVKADVIVVLEKGKIVDSGSHSELMQSSVRYQQLYKKQS